ncbi:hypothetical protein [Saccharothrix australiensis]|uniref:hypothetical protein n=1 Tax=Saccharothrix australiensis TaxID=2072 RepID=UPI001FE40E87|nr:hypothetical protein [Saccharothrix australiensis]
MLAGLAGGVVFGLLMAGVGALPLVGSLIGVDDAIVGFLVHLVISAVAGALFGLLSGRIADQVVPVYAVSALYGVVWWLLGALVIMPLWLSVTVDPGMTSLVFVVGDNQWVSLFGHVFFGLTTGATLLVLRGNAR